MPQKPHFLKLTPNSSEKEELSLSKSESEIIEKGVCNLNLYFVIDISRYDYRPNE
jgi:hypothetical protein